jgi:L-2-hydroxycarboxylate dehydrogenase (NAD+)
MCLINEIVAGFIGGSLPTLRSREIPEGEKRTSSFYFQVIHPDAISGGAFACGRDQAANVKAVIEDVKAHGNENVFLPGQDFAQAAERSTRAGGLLFSAAEIREFNELAEECGAEPWDLAALPVA